jgi:hypothetical protein
MDNVQTCESYCYSSVTNLQILGYFSSVHSFQTGRRAHPARYAVFISFHGDKKAGRQPWPLT